MRRFGWIPDRFEAARHWTACAGIAPAVAIREGDGRGATVLLHLAYERAAGRPFPVWTQGIGDCVGQGWALGLSTLQAVQCARTGAPYRADVCAEAVYGAARVEIAGRRLARNADGAVGAWAARACLEVGTLLREVYPGFDLAKYSARRSRDWGWEGVPDSLEPVARERPIKTARPIDSYPAARDWIATTQGPVVVCSDVGFEDRRDREGFARASGNWNHCMCFVAVDDASRRPGLLCCNSWGPDWISGPTRHGQPAGSFWVDAETAGRMLAQGDSYGISDYRIGVPTVDWVMF